MNYGMDYQGGDVGGGGGGFGGATQDSAEKKSRRSYDEQTLIPVTISMAFKARGDSSGGDESLTLADGRPLHSVKIVGAVRNVDAQSTNVMYTIEDGTGAIDVKQWYDDNDSNEVTEMRKAAIKEGNYITVIGQIKEYDGNKQLIANSVRSLVSGNELTHHLLEVMCSAEKFKRADSIVVPPVMQMHKNNMGFNSGSVMGGGVGVDGDFNKNRVLEILQRYNNESEEGVSIDRCVQELPDMSESEIRAAAELLSEEGQVYSTINENSFKVAM